MCVSATGLIGTAPSKELLDIWNEREGKLVKEGPDAITLGGVLHTRPLALLPEPKGALLGQVAKDSEDWKRIAGEAARTIPGYVAILQRTVESACAAEDMCKWELNVVGSDQGRHETVSSFSVSSPLMRLFWDSSQCQIKRAGNDWPSCMRRPGMMQAGERRQLRHQESDQGLQSVLPRCAPHAWAHSWPHMKCPIRYENGRHRAV